MLTRPLLDVSRAWNVPAYRTEHELANKLNVCVENLLKDLF